MDKKHKDQLKINDLIGNAVNNAIARRSQIDSESALSMLSDEETTSIAGGQLKHICLPTTGGCKPIHPPIIAGMMVPIDPKFTYKV